MLTFCHFVKYRDATPSHKDDLACNPVAEEILGEPIDNQYQPCEEKPRPTQGEQLSTLCSRYSPVHLIFASEKDWTYNKGYRPFAYAHFWPW